MEGAGWRRIAAELVPIACVLACLGLTLGLIGVALTKPTPARRVAVASAPRPVAAAPTPRVDVSPPRLPELDVGPGEWLAIAAEIAAEEGRAAELVAQARLASGAAEGLEREVERLRAAAETARVRMDGIAAQIVAAERATVGMEVERGALQRRRDALRAELAAARARGGEAFAVVPMAGPRGTWRQPIVIDCQEDRVSLLPEGPTFGLLDLGLGYGSRGSRLSAAVRRRAAEAQGAQTPDGRPSIPYLLFLVRPEGIRAYYEARAGLEPLGIAFGYELIDAEWEIEVPTAGPAVEMATVANAAPGRMGGGGLDEELPVWSGNDPAGSGLPGGEGGWKIGFAEAIDAEMAEARPTARSGGFHEEQEISGMVGERGGSPGVAGGSRTPRGRPPADEASSAGEGGAGVEAGLGGTAGAQPTDVRGGASAHPMGESPRVAAPEAGDSGGSLRGSRLSPTGGRGDARSGQGLWNAIAADADQPDDGSGGSRNPEGSRPLLGGTTGGRGLPGGVQGGGSMGSGIGLVGTAAGGAATSGGGDVIRPGAPEGMVEGAKPAAVLQSGVAAVQTPFGGGGGPGRWYDIRVVCEPTGVVLQPGGYRLSRNAMEFGGLLLPRVRDLARRGARAEDGTPLQPRLRFVVAPGGEAMFWQARRQTTFAGLEWPATLQVAESGRLGGLVGTASEVLGR